MASSSPMASTSSAIRRNSARASSTIVAERLRRGLRGDADRRELPRSPGARTAGMLRCRARLRSPGDVRRRRAAHRRSARVSFRQGLTMHELDIAPTQIDPNLAKPALYASVVAQTRALLEGERDAIANLANTTSLLYHSLPDLNWVGLLSAARTASWWSARSRASPRACGSRSARACAARRPRAVRPSIVRERARVRRPHRLRLGVELGDRRAADARRRAASACSTSTARSSAASTRRIRRGWRKSSPRC